MKKIILSIAISLISFQVWADSCESVADTSLPVIRRAQSDLLYCSLGDGAQLSFLRIFDMKDPKPGCDNPERRVVLGVGTARRVTPQSPIVAEAHAEMNGFYRFEMEDGSTVICSKGSWH